MKVSFFETAAPSSCSASRRSRGFARSEEAGLTPPDSPGAAFTEGIVEADGVRLRYAEAGHGVPLVSLDGPGGLRLTAAHELLARRFRVVVFETPDAGWSPDHDPSLVARSRRRFVP
jgi:hypothetical protein